VQDPPAIGAADAPPGYQLAWADEFDGTALDASKWTAMNDSNYGSGNHEDECYFAANATEAGGQVSLTAQRQTVQCGGTNPDTGDHTYDFTSAFLTTRGGGPGGGDKYAFTYGYAEARIQMPKGNPYWGAFWLVGASGGPAWPDYGEFDVTELVGGYPDLTYGTFHYACAGHTNCQTSPHIYNLDTESAYGGSSNNGTPLTPSNFASYTGQTSSRFVRYGFLWEPGRITWYVDGRPVRSFDGTHLVRYATDADGIIASTTVEKTVGTDLTAPSIPFATVFANPHTIDLNLAFGGAFPQGDGYTGGETASGYDDGNLAAELPGAMSVDYVRVFQL
jgi:beta-glucanase (GH16 family)